MRSLLSQALNKIWYQKGWQALVLLPLTFIYSAIIKIRLHAYEKGWKQIHQFPVPIIVVGNLTVGGSGKTPLVIWLVDFLRKAGFKPAIISRGYGGKARNWPQQVRIDSDPYVVGDEAVMLARHCDCPIAVGPNRSDSVTALLEHTDCNVILSDDGLQHYALDRDIEILVVDAVRRFGNQWLLPAGPLREPISRRDEVDFVVSNGIAGRGEYAMSVKGQFARNIISGETRSLEHFQKQKLHVVCGIGHPERFLNDLRQYSLEFDSHIYVDHHRYQPEDICFDDTLLVLMTEKDAVKCSRFASDLHWYVPVSAELNKHFGPRLLTLLEQRKKVLQHTIQEKQDGQETA